MSIFTKIANIKQYFSKYLMILELIKLGGLIKKSQLARKLKETFEGEDMKGKTFLQSKKVKVFLVGVISLFLTNLVGLDPAVVEKLMTAVLSLVGIYMGGETGVDIMRALKQPTIIDAPKTDDK